MADRTEAPAARAAREEFANDLKGMTNVEIEQEIIIEQAHLAEIEPWLEALIAELEHRQGDD